MVLPSPDQRISVSDTLLSLGAALFFPDVTTHAQVGTIIVMIFKLVLVHYLMVDFYF